MVLGRSGVTGRSWRPGLGTIPRPGIGVLGALGAWTGPGSDPGAPYTRAKLRVMSVAEYQAWRAAQPGYSLISDEQVAKILDDLYAYRLCYWTGQCSPGHGPTSYETLPSGEETTTGLPGTVQPGTVQPGTVIQLDTFIDDQYTLPSGTSQDTSGGGSGSTGGSGAMPPAPAVGGGNVDVGGATGAPAGMEIMGIPILYLALGAGALFLMTQGKKGRF